MLKNEPLGVSFSEDEDGKTRHSPKKRRGTTDASEGRLTTDGRGTADGRGDSGGRRTGYEIDGIPSEEEAMKKVKVFRVSLAVCQALLR